MKSNLARILLHKLSYICLNHRSNWINGVCYANGYHHLYDSNGSSCIIVRDNKKLTISTHCMCSTVNNFRITANDDGNMIEPVLEI